MGETNTRPGLASYRDAVTELMGAGKPFVGCPALSGGG
jgi:5,10-methenyltetrahydromethanopterin hydrogenase